MSTVNATPEGVMSAELNPADFTPMMQQFLEIKRAHPQSLLLYRMGDFYETFFEDARTAARELEITLTSRDGGKGQRVDMAGVPFHALEAYLPKLIQRGYKVAICEQMEPPKPGKLVRREVVRVITAGTLLEGALLNEKKNNYLGALCRQGKTYGLAYVDISTGAFRLTEVSGPDADDVLSRELAGLELAELLLPSAEPWRDQAVQQTDWGALLPDPAIVSWEAEQAFGFKAAYDRLKRHFGVVSLESFGCQQHQAGVAAAGAVLHYLARTQMSALRQINALQVYQLNGLMLLDRSTRRNLELTATYRENSFAGSLLWVLDHCRTAMGGRMLRDWLSHPLLQRQPIEARLDAVEELAGQRSLRSQLREALDGVRDLERLAARVATQHANPRELKALAESLLRLPKITALLEASQSERLAPLRLLDMELQDLAHHVLDSLVETPPIKIQDGDIFRDGIYPELDQLRSLVRGGKEWIHELERSERERTGIKSLKVSYNKAFGYYIEISHANQERVPEDYIRKQTLTNAERYITPALKDKEAAVLNAAGQIEQVEYQCYLDLRQSVMQYVPRLQTLARQVAEADVLASLAEVAVNQAYVRPHLHSEPILEIVGGRHPVIEQTLPAGQFVPNDTRLDPEHERLVILTGPNMSGKSSYMRQIGLIVLLAQMGSFVPAERAEIGLCDRIFTRVGAVDDIATGQSTFMVEMMETASILHHATPQSLVLLDEIGRGTSTFDGVSIAWAVSEYLATQIRARTLFATHYHELNRLASEQSGVCNYQVSVQENADGIVFLHKVVPGGADRSYGIEVARLAGLPGQVLNRSRELLQDIERRSRIQSGLLKKTRGLAAAESAVQLSFLEES